MLVAQTECFGKLTASYCEPVRSARVSKVTELRKGPWLLSVVAAGWSRVGFAGSWVEQKKRSTWKGASREDKASSNALFPCVSKTPKAHSA